VRSPAPFFSGLLRASVCVKDLSHGLAVCAVQGDGSLDATD
jgi:hypothetical protein